jgi:hypothetical protein
MGNQQLLIIVIAMVIMGIAVAVGVTMFRDSAKSSNRDQLAVDCVHYGVRAQAYYRRPATFGGGGTSFKGLTMAKIASPVTNMNGTYTLDPDPVTGTPASIKITGTGTETGWDGTSPVRIVMVVFADTMRVDESLSN